MDHFLESPRNVSGGHHVLMQAWGPSRQPLSHQCRLVSASSHSTAEPYFARKAQHVQMIGWPADDWAPAKGSNQGLYCRGISSRVIFSRWIWQDRRYSAAFLENTLAFLPVLWLLPSKERSSGLSLCLGACIFRHGRLRVMTFTWYL